MGESRPVGKSSSDFKSRKSRTDITSCTKETIWKDVHHVPGNLFPKQNLECFSLIFVPLQLLETIGRMLLETEFPKTLG